MSDARTDVRRAQYEEMEVQVIEGWTTFWKWLYVVLLFVLLSALAFGSPRGIKLFSLQAVGILAVAALLPTLLSLLLWGVLRLKHLAWIIWVQIVATTM